MRYHNITKEDMLNGDGLRVVLWVAGCSHGCKGCQNPITWDPKGGLEFDEAAKEEIYEQMEKSYVAGITFSGGDPLYQGNRLEITAFAKELKEKYPKKTIWLYTGYLWEEIQDLEILPYLDVVEVDIQLPGTVVIDVKKSLEAGSVVLHDQEEL